MYIGTNADAKTRAGKPGGSGPSKWIAVNSQQCDRKVAQEIVCRRASLTLRDCMTTDCNSRMNVILWYWLVGLRIVSGP